MALLAAARDLDEVRERICLLTAELAKRRGIALLVE